MEKRYLVYYPQPVKQGSGVHSSHESKTEARKVAKEIHGTFEEIEILPWEDY